MSNELEDYIIQAALRHKIDPQVALRVAKGEGGLQNPFRHGEGPAPRTQDPALGHLENSYGPFQLYVSGTGAGRYRVCGRPHGVALSCDEIRRPSRPTGVVDLLPTSLVPHRRLPPSTARGQHGVVDQSWSLYSAARHDRRVDQAAVRGRGSLPQVNL